MGLKMTTILSSAMRSNLNSASLLMKQMENTQERVSTGRKVNSAADDAYAYFTEKRLRSTSSTLDFISKEMDKGMKTIGAAVNAINSIDDLAERAKGLLRAALETEDRWEREGFRGQYEELIKSMQDVAENAEYRGVNLLGDSTNRLSLDLNQDGSNRLNINGATDANDNFTDLEGTAFGFDLGSTVPGFNIASGLGASEGTVAVGSGLTLQDNLVTDGAYAVGESFTISQNISDGTASIGSLDYTYTVTADSTIEDVIADINGSGKFRAELVSGALSITSVGAVDGNTGAATENYLSFTDGSAAGTIFGAFGATTYAAVDTATSNSFFMLDSAIDAQLTLMENFQTTLQNREGVLANFEVITQAHYDNTINMISLLEEGADNLVVADVEEESVKLNVLQTRQQLAMVSISLSTQAEQNIMRLF